MQRNGRPWAVWSGSTLFAQTGLSKFYRIIMGRIKRIWYLSPMRTAKVQASLRIHAVSPEPPLLAHTGSESRGTFRQKARSLAPLNGWACAVKIHHEGMPEDTNSPDGAHYGILFLFQNVLQNRNTTLIRNTVKKLPVQMIIPLIQELTKRLHGHAQR